MQVSLNKKSQKFRAGVIIVIFFIITIVIVVQWLVKPTVEDVSERIVERERVSLSTRAELHWQSMILGDRDAFLAGLSNDVLFVIQLGDDGVSDGEGKPIVLNGLSAVADAYDLGSLKSLRARGAIVTILEQTEDRVVGTVLSEVETTGGEDRVRIFEFTATVRIDPNGRVFEERLEILYVAEGMENVLNR